MLGVYTVSAKAASVSAAGVIFALSGTKLRELYSLEIGNANQDTNEQFEVVLHRSTGTAAGGSAVTPRPTEAGTADASARAGAAITGLTLTEEVHRMGGTLLGGAALDLRPEEGLFFDQNVSLAVELIGAIQSTDLVIAARFREYL